MVHKLLWVFVFKQCLLFLLLMSLFTLALPFLRSSCQSFVGLSWMNFSKLPIPLARLCHPLCSRKESQAWGDPGLLWLWMGWGMEWIFSTAHQKSNSRSWSCPHSLSLPLPVNLPHVPFGGRLLVCYWCADRKARGVGFHTETSGEVFLGTQIGAPGHLKSLVVWHVLCLPCWNQNLHLLDGRYEVSNGKPVQR